MKRKSGTVGYEIVNVRTVLTPSLLRVCTLCKHPVLAILYSVLHIGLGLIASPRRGLTMGKESMPKIVINNTIIIKTAIGILLISNHNSFRVLSDKIASV